MQFVKLTVTQKEMSTHVKQPLWPIVVDVPLG